MHRGLIKSATPPPYVHSNKQPDKEQTVLTVHAFAFTYSAFTQKRTARYRSYLPPRGGYSCAIFWSWTQEYFKQILCGVLFLKGTGFWKLLSWCINLQNLQSHWFSFDMKTKTSPVNPQLHFSQFDLSVCLFHKPHADALLCFQAQRVCMCTWYQVCDGVIIQSSWQAKSPWKHCYWCHDTGFSCEHTHTLCMRYQVGVQLCKDMRDKKAHLSQGANLIDILSFRISPAWLGGVQRTKPLNFDCVCVCIISEALKRLKKTHLYFSHDVECPFWNVTINMSVKWPKQRRGDVCCPCFPAGAFLCVSFIDVFPFRHKCLFQSVCVWLTLQSLCNLVEEVIRSRTPPAPRPELKFWRGGAAKAVGKFLLLIGLWRILLQIQPTLRVTLLLCNFTPWLVKKKKRKACSLTGCLLFLFLSLPVFSLHWNIHRILFLLSQCCCKEKAVSSSRYVAVIYGNNLTFFFLFCSLW